MQRLIKGGWGDQTCFVLVSACVVATAATALVVDRVDSVSLLVLGLIGMYLGFRYGFGRALSGGEKLFIWIVAFYFGLSVFGYVNGAETNLGFRILGRYFRFLFMIPVYLALRRLAPPRWLVWFAFVAGSTVAASSALWQYFQSNGVVRAAGDSIAITFGDLALLSGFLAAVLVPPVTSRWRWPLRAVAVIGLAGGLVASILSGTRGGWLAIPVFGVLLIAAWTRGFAARWRAAAFAVAAAIAAIVVAVPASGMLSRLAEAVQGWHDYRHYRDTIIDVPRGSACISSPAIIKGLAHLALLPDKAGTRIAPAREADALAAAGFGSECRGGSALHLSNHGGQGRSWVSVSRIVNHADLPGFAAVLARGHGRIRLPGGGEKTVHWRQYRKVLIAVPPQKYINYSTLQLSAAPGGDLYVVPIEVNPGAYRYFFTATSVGARLAMWGTAWDIFVRHWGTGAGTGAYRAMAQERVDAGQAAPVTAVYDHPHNQYLNDMASRGLLGLAELLLLLGVPAWLFAGRLRAAEPAVRQMAHAGMMATCGFGIFGLTETVFNHSLTIGCFVIFVGLFAALMFDAEEWAAHTLSSR